MKYLVCFCLVAVLIYVTLIPLCGYIFKCGCSWSDGLQNCNVHNAEGPHCPWCTETPVPFWGLVTLILMGTGVVVFASFKLFKLEIWVGVVISTVVYFLVASLIGLVSVIFTKYPIFYGFVLH